MNDTPINDTVKDEKAGDAAMNDSASNEKTSDTSDHGSRKSKWRGPMLAAALVIGTAAVYAVYWYWWGSDASTASTVNVTLNEWSVSLDAPSVAAGLIKFQVRNDGPGDTHEFVVVKTDLAPEQLPVGANGAVEENGAGIEIIGEIEDITVGAATHLKAFDLAPGKYVLICNSLGGVSHYQQGMRAAFTVTAN